MSAAPIPMNAEPCDYRTQCEPVRARFDKLKAREVALRVENLGKVFRNADGAEKRDIVPNINFFMNVPIEQDGGLAIVDGVSSPGDYVELRAEMDVICVISNCPQINNPCNGFNPTPIRVTVREG